MNFIYNQIMATLTLEIEDKQLSFFKKLIQNFKFVQVQETAELDGDTDDEIRENIRRGVAQMRLVEEGKMKTTPLKDFLKELDGV